MTCLTNEYCFFCEKHTIRANLGWCPECTIRNNKILERKLVQRIAVSRTRRSNKNRVIEREGE